MTWETAMDILSTYALAKAGLFAWLAGANEVADDADVVECHEFVLSALSDADQAAKIKAVTGKDIRDLTVEEVTELHREMELRGFDGRN
jgi:hypothetical protein